MNGSTVWIFVILFREITSRTTCTNTITDNKAEFYKVAPCSASGMSIIARTNTSSIKRCSQFANLKQGLAFNYGPQGKTRSMPENCLVYDCPEYDILQSIRKERDYDYFSLYADPLPVENTTCIIGVGMFNLHEERANYTEAMETCREEGGELANVLTEKRTNGLSNMVASMRVERKAYVGMDDIEQEGKFMTVSGKLLSCYEYRAWAPGEPRNRKRSEDCVVVNDRGGWKVVDCSRRLPFICELLPKGPLPIKDDPKINRCDLDLSNRKTSRRAPKDKKFYKKSLILHWKLAIPATVCYRSIFAAQTSERISFKLEKTKELLPAPPSPPVPVCCTKRYPHFEAAFCFALPFYATKKSEGRR